MSVDEHDEFWKQVLTPGHKYEVRWQDGPNAPWAYRGETQLQDPAPRLPVHLFSTAIKLTVLSHTSAPPFFSVSLAPTAKMCHLSGEPSFGFRLQITSHADDVLTVCLNKTPLKELHGLEDIAYTVDENNEEIEWPCVIGCWGEEESFPADDLFEEFVPHVPYERTFWLDKYDPKTSRGGELDMLEASRVYTVCVSKELIESFGWWRRGRKEELLAGSEKEKEERWRGSTGSILLDVSKPFTFEAV
jgi:hypothetical protein